VPHSWLIHVLQIYKIYTDDELNRTADEEIDIYPPNQSKKSSDYE